MRNLFKRIFTSIVIFPLSIFFLFKGSYYLLFFLFTIFFIANYELLCAFKKKITIIFLNLILILSLSFIYNLTENLVSFYLLLWIIILVICSDIGGYVFGKIFKWKKITKISPNKTLSGVLGAFVFSLLSLFIANSILPLFSKIFQPVLHLVNFLDPKFFFLAIILSLVAQAGDLTISYFKRNERVKDMGKILPGHGGILDRIDGLMFVIILAFILIKFNIIP